MSFPLTGDDQDASAPEAGITTTTSALTARAVGSQRRLLRVTLVAALAWSAGLVVAAVLWGTGLAPLPFAAFDPEEFSSLIEMLPAAAATIVLALVAASDALPLAESWATLGPETLWPLWGIALGIALTEYVRRRVRIREAV